MTVGIQSNPNAAMPQPFLDDFGMHAAHQHQGGMRMSEIMEPNATQSCSAQNSRKYPPDGARIQGATEIHKFLIARMLLEQRLGQRVI
jgi:hypothetical protein